MDQNTDDPREILARLRAEKARRVDAKVQAGKAVLVPLTIVSSTLESAAAQIEQEKEKKLAELRDAGEQREVIFDVPKLIISGVSRPWDSAQHSASSDSAEQAAVSVPPKRRRRSRTRV